MVAWVNPRPASGRSAVRISARETANFFVEIAKFAKKFLLHFILNTDTIASDFEEHLGLGLGKNASNTEIWIVAVYCEEEDLKRNKKRVA